MCWIDESIKEILQGDSFQYNTEKVISLIDKHISCRMPEDQELRQLVQDLQIHRCSKTCKKKGPKCRFGFPKLPSEETLISEPIDKNDEAQVEEFKEGRQILKKVTEHIESENFRKDDSLAKILSDLDIHEDAYKKALKQSDRGKQVILKQSPNEFYVNNYNERCLKAFKANMDLQFCMDVYAVVTYVCDYWSKDETGMTEFLKEALKEAKSLGHKEKLSHLKRTYMSKRQIGKSEAIYRALPSLHLQDSNIACTFVQVNFLRFFYNSIMLAIKFNFKRF